MAENWFARLMSSLRGRREWYELPRLRAVAQLIHIRDRLRRENLYDTEELPLEASTLPPLDASQTDARSPDGCGNDLAHPAMGAAFRRFGRNVPLEHVWPDTARL